MNFEDLKRLLTGPVLFTLESIISPRLVPMIFGLGLAAIGLWAIGHMVWAFSLSFSNGLWGLIEIAIYGPLALLLLRVLCEAIMIYFKANQTAAANLDRPSGNHTLMDEVGAAIRDLAGDDDHDDYMAPATAIPPGVDMSGDASSLPQRPGIRRTARRSPKL